MGTNYYWHAGNGCDRCGSGEDVIHVGKSSCGWCFALHVKRPPGGDYDRDPDNLPEDLEGWTELFQKPGSFIRNEYGETVTVEFMLRQIMQRDGTGGIKEDAEWYARNYAKPGPKGLARHTGDGSYGMVIGRPGPDNETWDYSYGEFS